MELNEDEEDEALLRTLIRPEEDRPNRTTNPRVGGFRWFRSPNVICLEKVRLRQRTGSPTHHRMS